MVVTGHRRVVVLATKRVVVATRERQPENERLCSFWGWVVIRGWSSPENEHKCSFSGLGGSSVEINLRIRKHTFRGMGLSCPSPLPSILSLSCATTAAMLVVVVVWW